MAKSRIWLLAGLSLLPAQGRAQTSATKPVLQAVQVFPEKPAETRRKAGADGPITISRRPWYPICAGLCPSFDLTVWPDGRVLSIVYNFGESSDDDATDAARWTIFRTVRHTVSAKQVRAFRAALERWRPDGERFLHERCLHNDPDFPDSELAPRHEIEIRWLPIGHVVGCDYDRELQAAAYAALEAIGFTIAGMR